MIQLFQTTAKPIINYCKLKKFMKHDYIFASQFSLFNIELMEVDKHSEELIKET